MGLIIKVRAAGGGEGVAGPLSNLFYSEQAIALVSAHVHLFNLVPVHIFSSVYAPLHFFRLVSGACTFGIIWCTCTYISSVLLPSVANLKRAAAMARRKFSSNTCSDHMALLQAFQVHTHYII